MKPTLSILAVWTPSWILHMVLLQTYPSVARHRPGVASRRDADED
jgi:hypothetical protein